MLLSFAACNKKETGVSTPQETVKLDVETLKNNWQSGEIVFPNGKKVKIPCKVSEFIEQSGLIIANSDSLGNKILSPKETVTLNIAGEGLTFNVIARNTGKKENLPYTEAMVVEYNFNNTNEANRQILFAGTLTPGVTRDAVEKALGIPEGQKAEDTIYYYKGKNENNKKVELRVSFNSENIVNSVSYEIVY